ncbi:MAG: DNA recombination protein RmuC [Gammaproteobacteria bacterium]|nr:DNA recombination protein RmuC [Gammaproteobacteria bacterium]
MTTGTLIIIILLSVLIGLAGYSIYLLTRDKGESDDVLRERLQSRQLEIQKLQDQVQNVQGEFQEANERNASLRETVSRRETQLSEERSQNQEKIQLLENAREKMSLEFKNLANEILEKKGKDFTENNRENIENILKPLREKIQQFEKKVEDTYNRESNERFSLQKEIKNLQDMNSRLSTDALNLTNALKGESKTQGTWGEFVLERLLEQSGLRKGREYEVQVSLRTEEGSKKQQPDVIIHLPENKDVIIDSKVSLTAYERYYSESDEAKKAEALKQHILSIRTHIRSLSEKNYQNLEGVRTLDFIMMFLPVESAFALAVQHDQSLFTEAFERNIALVGPTTLMATLRTIQNIWRYEDQNKHAMEIAGRAGKLYDKFVGFTEDLDKIGAHLNQTQISYDNAHKKLTTGHGNLVSNVEKLKILGAKASKSLPGSLIDESFDQDHLADSEEDAS